MNKNKGFTLIELLAVIVILAIIALIATPLIMNIINDVKKGAFLDNSYAIINAAEQGYAKGLIKNKNSELTEYEYINGTMKLQQGNVEVNYKGSSPESGNLLINEEGEVGIAFYSNGWCAIKLFDSEELNLKKVNNKTDCVFEDGESGIVYNLSLMTMERINSNGKTSCSNNNNIYDATCYFKGTNEEVYNNYLQYHGFLWRILNINSDGTVSIITDYPIVSLAFGASSNHKNFCNPPTFINDTYTWLNDEESGYFYKNMPAYVKDSITTTATNIGNSDNPISSTCISNVGILDLRKYALAGGKDSFLDIKQFQMVPQSYKTENKMSYIKNDGTIGGAEGCVGETCGTHYNNPKGIRPVITLNANTEIIGYGEDSGSKNNPLYVKGETFIKQNQSISSVRAGEFIKIPTVDNEYETVAVIENSDNKIKVISEKIYGTSKFGSDIYLSAGDPIVTKLNEFKDTIKTGIINLDNHTWYLGTYDSSVGNVNKLTADGVKTYTGVMGLIRVGELFATSKREYDLTIRTTFWSLTPMDNSGVRPIYINSSIGRLAPNDYELGVRPVFYLNNQSKVVSGNGSPTNPYIIK